MAHYILACSHQRSDWAHDGAEYYRKRINKFEPVQYINLKKIAYPSKENPETIKTQETKRLLALVPKQSVIIVCDSSGDALDSINFSKIIAQTKQKSPNIAWIIGPAYGLDLTLLSQYKKISLSNLTFPHEMVKCILLEQIYRGIMIEKNHPYHL